MIHIDFIVVVRVVGRRSNVVRAGLKIVTALIVRAYRH